MNLRKKKQYDSFTFVYPIQIHSKSIQILYLFGQRTNFHTFQQPLRKKRPTFHPWQEYVRKVDLLILDWKSPPKQGPKEVTVSIGRGEPTKVALWGSREQLLTKFPASIWDAPW